MLNILLPDSQEQHMKQIFAHFFYRTPKQYDLFPDASEDFSLQFVQHILA